MASGWFNEPRRHSLASKGVKTASNGKPAIDLERYQGRWYDVGHYPTWYQRDCETSIADYKKNNKGVSVKNTCIDKQGMKSTIEGDATIDSPDTLGVSFFPPFRSPYKIEWVSNDYERAIVGHPKKENLWFLSRNKSLNKKEFDEMKNIAKKKGYATSKLTNIKKR